MSGQHALGVLFVHGIGEQVRGRTLEAFGEPLVTLLRRVARQRLGATDHHHVATWDVDDRVGHHPPTWQLDFCEEHPTAVAPGSWLLAESHWADVVEAPSYRELAWWGLQVLPLTVALHVIALGRQRWSRDHFAEPVDLRTVSSWAGRLLLLPVMAGLALLGTVGVAALTIVGLLPVAHVRRWVRTLQLRLSETLGDSYVLIERMRRADTIRARVTHDLEWLRQRCDRVAVVAHSQGAAIAHRILRDQDERDGLLFISVGSGLGKLHDIRTARTEQRKMVAAGWAFLVGVVALVIWPPVLLSLLYTGYDWAAAGGRPSWPQFGVLVTVLLSFGAAAALEYLRDRYERRDRELTIPDLRWLDVYASADPVANGALLSSSGGAHTEVTNAASVLRDHGSYVRNRDEFAAILAFELSAFGGVGLATPSAAELERFRAQRRRRAWRGRVLRWTRRVTFVGVGLLAAATWPQLTELATRGVEFALALGTRVDSEWVGWLAQRPDSIALAATWMLAGVVVCVWLLPLTVTEVALDHHDTQRFLGGSLPDSGGWPLVLHLSVPSLALAIGLATLAAPDPGALAGTVTNRLLRLLPALFVAVFVAYVIEAKDEERPVGRWLQDLGRAAVAGATCVAAGWVAVRMWPAAFPHPSRVQDFGVAAYTGLALLAAIAVGVARLGERQLGPVLAQRIANRSVRLPGREQPSQQSAARQELVTAISAGLIGGAIGATVNFMPVAGLAAMAGAGTAGLGLMSARRRTYDPADRLVLLEAGAAAAAALALLAPVLPRIAEWGADVAETGRTMLRPILVTFNLATGAMGAVDGLGLLARTSTRSELLDIRISPRFRLAVGTAVLAISLTAAWVGVLLLRGRSVEALATAPLVLLVAFALIIHGIPWFRRLRAWGPRDETQWQRLSNRLAALRDLVQRADELSRLARLHPSLDPEEVEQLTDRIGVELTHVAAQQAKLMERHEHSMLQRAT